MRLLRSALKIGFPAIAFIGFGLQGCKKDRDPTYVNWEEIDLGRGNADVQYLRKTSRALLVSTPNLYIRIGRDFMDGAIRISNGFGAVPNSNSEVVVDLVDKQTLSVFAFDGELNSPLAIKVPKVNDHQLSIIGQFFAFQTSRRTSPVTLSPHDRTTDTTHIFYFAQGGAGIFFVDQPIYVPPHPYNPDKGYILAADTPKYATLASQNSIGFFEPTYHKGFVYTATNDRVEIASGLIESFENKPTDYIALESPVNDTIFGITYISGSENSILLMKTNSGGSWDDGLAILRPGPTEAIGKVGRWMAIGFNSQPCFSDFATKKCRCLSLGNLPKNRVMSAIAEFDDYVYIGYRYGGLFRKSKKEVEAELSRIP